MRIHRIALRNYRGVEQAEVSLPASGVTIIDGPNEVGKSSLLEAVQHLFAYRDTSTRSEIRAVAPVHGEAVPEATVDVSTGPYRFTYTKRWHRKHGTTSLSITEPTREQLHGREAHERVEQILSHTLDRPLWDALRSEQGTGPDGGGFAGARSLSRALDLAAGGESAVDQGDALWDRIVAERDRYWYATGKPRAEGVDLAKAVATACAELDAASADLQGLDALTDEADTLDITAEGLQRRVTERRQAVTRLVGRAEAVTLRRAEVQSAREAHAAAASEEARLAALIGQRAELMRRAAQCADAAAAAEQALAAAAPQRAAAEQARETAIEALASAEVGHQEAVAAHDLATADRDHARQQIEVAQLTERRDRVAAARTRADQARQVLAANPVSTSVLAGIETAHLDVVRAMAASDVSATAIEATAIAPVELMVDGEMVTLAAEQRHELAVSGSTELVLPGVARIVIRAGVEAGERAKRLQAAEEALATRLQAVGATDLDDARRRAAERADAASTVTAGDAAIARDLRDLTFDELAGKVRRLSERVATYRGQRAAEPPPPDELSAAQAHATATEAAVAVARNLVAERERTAHATEVESRQAEVAGVARATELDLARQSLQRDEEALATARADRSDRDLGEQAATAAATRAAADRTLDDAAAALHQVDPDGTTAALGEARQAQSEAERAHAVSRERRQELRIQLEIRGEDGLPARIDQAATRHQHLVRQHDGWQRRAEAARHLHDVFARRRQETRRRYEAPLAERIEELGRVVFGPSLQVQLDADLAIASRTVDGVTVPFDHLSTGAREQLGLLSRLACATLVDPADGVPVVLDDVLGWTDPQRLTDMGAAIAEAGRSTQVIILTCTPDRFNALEATAVHLGPEPVPAPAPSAAASTPRRSRRTAADADVPTLFPVAERPAS